jgi:hypothetical protein
VLVLAGVAHMQDDAGDVDVEIGLLERCLP